MINTALFEFPTLQDPRPPVNGEDVFNYCGRLIPYRQALCLWNEGFHPPLPARLFHPWVYNVVDVPPTSPVRRTWDGLLHPWAVVRMLYAAEHRRCVPWAFPEHFVELRRVIGPDRSQRSLLTGLIDYVMTLCAHERVCKDGRPLHTSIMFHARYYHGKPLDRGRRLYGFVYQPKKEGNSHV